MSEKMTTQEKQSEHFHHWKIEEPNGQVSQGVCKVCGETREFNNWLSDGDFTTNTERQLAA